MDASGIVLAGGHSSRMGRNKAMLQYNAETIIERTVRELQKEVSDIIIAVNDTLKYHISGAVNIPDVYPDSGPLGGIHAGLLQAKYRHAFVISCDMPLFSAWLAGYLLDRSPGYDVVVPKVNGRWEPLCAVYSKDCLEAIEKHIQRREKKVTRIYPELRVLEIDQQELMKLGKTQDLFYNMNTPEDYRSLLQR